MHERIDHCAEQERHAQLSKNGRACRAKHNMHHKAGHHCREESAKHCLILSGCLDHTISQLRY